MKGTLVLTILAVKGSFREDLELPVVSAVDVPDTVQWWVSSAGCWRIKTFAIDHDIHVYSLGKPENLEETALANTIKTYGDVIRSNHTISLNNAYDEGEVRSAFLAEGLEPRIEISDGRFMFWKPDNGRYHTQSEPKR